MWTSDSSSSGETCKWRVKRLERCSRCRSFCFSFSQKTGGRAVEKSRRKIGVEENGGGCFISSAYAQETK